MQQGEGNGDGGCTSPSLTASRGEEREDRHTHVGTGDATAVPRAPAFFVFSCAPLRFSYEHKEELATRPGVLPPPPTPHLRATYEVYRLSLPPLIPLTIPRLADHRHKDESSLCAVQTHTYTHARSKSHDELHISHFIPTCTQDKRRRRR